MRKLVLEINTRAETDGNLRGLEIESFFKVFDIHKL